MVDTRLAPTFLTSPKIDRLGDDEYRLYVNGLVWSVSNEADGFVSRRALLLLHPTHDDPMSLARALVAAGLWEPVESVWQVHDFLDHQTSRAELQHRRLQDRDRKAAARQAAESRRPQGTRTDFRGGREQSSGADIASVPQGTHETADASAADNGQIPQRKPADVPRKAGRQERQEVQASMREQPQVDVRDDPSRVTAPDPWSSPPLPLADAM